MGIFQRTQIELKSFGLAVLGLAYISLSWGLLMDLYATTMVFHMADAMHIISGLFFLIIIIASIWINDTMAYIVGSIIGKTPLSKISPKKTWEGTAGGAILCVVVMVFVFPLIFYKAISGTGAQILVGLVALTAGVMGTIGDLIESKFKRIAGVKDSGSIMPGHGGILDRLDSVIFVAPIIFLFYQILYYVS